MTKHNSDERYIPYSDRLDRFFRTKHHYRLLKISIFTSVVLLAFGSSIVAFTPQRISKIHYALAYQSRIAVSEMRLTMHATERYLKATIPPQLILPVIQILGCWSVRALFSRPDGTP